MHQSTDFSQEEDLVDERRLIFGEQETQEPDGSESDDSIERNPEEEEEEFLIVMQACRERKRFEEDAKRPMMREKLSQTGWKIRSNFLKKTHLYMDDKDRIDVFAEKATVVREERRESVSSGECMILDYN